MRTVTKAPNIPKLDGSTTNVLTVRTPFGQMLSKIAESGLSWRTVHPFEEFVLGVDTHYRNLWAEVSSVLADLNVE